jgi:hypothetical protein
MKMWKDKMKCPFCKKELIPGKPRSYETLSEHVCDPNGEDGDPGERPTWECTCEYSKDCDVFWDEQGDIYVGNGRAYDRHFVFYHSAVGSLAREIDIRMNLYKLRDMELL